MWDYDNNSLPIALTQIFTILDNIQSVKTRGALKGNLYLPKVNTTKYGMKSFRYRGVEILNNLKNMDIYHNANNKINFLRSLKHHLLDKY